MTSTTTARISDLASTLASDYSSDTIIILGKGPSADEVSPRVFKGNVVIGVNDSERIQPADVTIFHEEWVADSLKDDGLRSKAYITSVEDFEAPGHTVVSLPFEPLSNDEEDIMLSRFQSRDKIAIEEAMFLTALEVARTIADHKGKTQSVYMVGFDFTPGDGNARAANTQFTPQLTSHRKAGVELQQYILRNALYVLEDSNLDVHHVGTHEFSNLTTESLNEKFHVTVKEQAALTETEEEPVIPAVEVTAEITTNHFGDMDRLEKLVRAAHAAGADWVKVQKRDVEHFYTPEQLASPYRSPFGTTFGDYRHQLELDKEGFKFLDELTKDLGIKWFASVLDKPSFEWMAEELDIPLVKLPSTISRKKDYLEYVADNYTGSLVISTGMTDKAYEDWLLETFTKQDTLYLLHCNSAYPTPDEHTNIGVVRHYAQLAEQQASKSGPRIVPGYSSHDFGWMASALAVAAGAGMVEKHVKLGNTEWAHFDAVAVDLTTEAFKEYVDAVRRAQVHVGSTEKKITASEHHKY